MRPLNEFVVDEISTKLHLPFFEVKSCLIFQLNSSIPATITYLAFTTHSNFAEGSFLLLTTLSTGGITITGAIRLLSPETPEMKGIRAPYKKGWQG